MKKLVHFEIGSVFWLTIVRNVSTKYGDSQVISFIDQKGCLYKSWISPSVYKEISRIAEGNFRLPLYTFRGLNECCLPIDFKGKRVIFKLVEKKEYNGSAYPRIVCRIVPNVE